MGSRLRYFALLLLVAACSGREDAGDDGSPSDVVDEHEAEVGDVADVAVVRDTSEEAADAALDGPSVRDASEEEDTEDSSDVVSDVPALPWRSTLYPEDWTAPVEDPGGDFLHDFSYAGYRGGAALPAPVGEAPTFDVTEFGADPSGASDSTPAFQAAVDAASELGGIVFVPAGSFRLDGHVAVRASGVVLRGAGSSVSHLFFPGASPSYRAHVLIAGDPTVDLELPLVTDGASVSSVVEVADARALAVGDDVVIGWTITAPFVEEHGMTGVWGPFNDTWQPFFRRNVIAVDTEATPHRVTLDVPLRYPAKLRDGASVRRVRGLLTECGVEGLGVANAVSWEQAWSESQVSVLELRDVADCWVRDVVSYPSPTAPSDGPGVGAHLRSSGIRVSASKRVTIADCHLAEAENRGGGGNGYLFEVRASSEVLTRNCTGRAGRHNFIQNWGFGNTGCVWLRVESSEGRVFRGPDDRAGTPGLCEFHHSLATANLIDSCRLDDGWAAENRLDWSSGAGHTSSQNVAWNVDGRGVLRWYNHGRGYVIGTGPDVTVATRILLPNSQGTEPEDFAEGIGSATELVPQSLYQDQRSRRLGR